jgi:hypothetical protein
MQRVKQTIPILSSNTYDVNSQRIYTRFHRKPQMYQPSFPTNKTIRIEKTIDQGSMNDFVAKIYKEKKYRGVLDCTSPNNKNIFIDTDSEHQKSEIGQDDYHQPRNNKKSTRLLIAKTESQFPETYNSQTVFRRDGLVRGYYIKVNNKSTEKFTDNYDINTQNARMINTYVQTPSQPEGRYIYDIKEPHTQIIREKKINLKLLNQKYNRNTISHGCFKKELGLDEWPSVEKTQKIINYKNFIEDKEMKSDSYNTESQNQNQIIYQNKKKQFPPGIIYKKGNISEIKRPSLSKSNISDISEDFLNQYKRQQMNENSNYIMAGNASEIGSLMDYRNNNEIVATSEEENDINNQNYMNQRIIRGDLSSNSNVIINDQGGKVDLNYGLKTTKKKKVEIIKKTVRVRKKIYVSIEDIIARDKTKLNLIIKLQRFIRSYLYLRELCAMKIQAVWRGGNTRKIMDLYNDLDEFIYHLSKVQFNHFNNDFCFFIKQLFNIYKSNVSNGNYKENEEIDNYQNENENNDVNNEDDENDNENCMNQITLEEIEQKERLGEYSYKFPEVEGEVAYFDQDKLEHENEISLSIQGTSPFYERKVGKQTKTYEKLVRDYEELFQKFNELKQNNINVINSSNIRSGLRKEKNESESTIGSIKSDYKFNKYTSHSREKIYYNKANSDLRPRKTDIRPGDNGKNLTFSKDDDAGLDINRDVDFFIQEISYDDKDNSGSLIKDKKFSCFSIHSDENSKYFDNENPKDREREIKEGDTYRNNISKYSGGSKYNNSSKYTGCSSRYDHYSKIYRYKRYDRYTKNEYSNSPSTERSNNYMGHHSKTFPRKYINSDSINNILIIPKHEEDFNIINKIDPNMFLSPKEREENKHIKSMRSDIAITPNIKLEDKNWNEIIEYIKNEEIEIPTQKKSENLENQKKVETKEMATEITTDLYLCETQPIFNEQIYLENIKKQKVKEPLVLDNNVAKVNIIRNKIYKKPRKLEGIEKNKKFEILEQEKSNEINLDNNDYKNKKLSQISPKHENEINIEKCGEMSEKEKSFMKIIEEKNKEIEMYKKQLEQYVNDIKMKTEQPKRFDSQLEINNNLNSLDIQGTKPLQKYNELLIKKIITQETKIKEESTIITEEKINKYINVLLEEKDKKEKEWNNLSINKNETISLKQEEEEEKNKNLISNIIIPTSIDTITIKNDKEEKDKEKEKTPAVYDREKNVEVNIIGKSRLVPELIEKIICKENQLCIKGNKKSIISSKETRIEEEEKKTQQKILRNVYKKPMAKKEIKDKKIITELSIDNCAQIKIDRIYENRNDYSPEQNKIIKKTKITINEEENIEKIEKKENRENIIHTQTKDIKEEQKELIEEKNKKVYQQQPFTNMQPEEQNNNRFTVVGTIKSKDEKEKEKEKEKESDIKAEIVEKKDIKEKTDINEKEKEKEDVKDKTKTIQIRTRVYRKSVKNKFSNNTIVSEKALNINGIEKTKPVLETESQDNNRFTVERTIG